MLSPWKKDMIKTEVERQLPGSLAERNPKGRTYPGQEHAATATISRKETYIMGFFSDLVAIRTMDLANNHIKTALRKTQRTSK